jgi:ATP dependent DNA ligase domain
VIARKEGKRVKLLRSCIIDGEAVACDDDGIADFNRIRYRRHDASVFLYGFDLIELDGEDMRRDTLAVRKARLASLLSGAAPGLRFTEQLVEEDGATERLAISGRSSAIKHRAWRTRRPRHVARADRRDCRPRAGQALFVWHRQDGQNCSASRTRSEKRSA